MIKAEFSKRDKDVTTRSKSEGRDALESERFVEERLLLHHAPRLWMKLKSCLEEGCNALNLKFGNQTFVFELVPSSRVVIRTKDKPCSLRVGYAGEGHRIYYECGKLTGEFLLDVQEDTKVLLRTQSGVPYTPEKASKNLLDMLIQSSAQSLE